MAVVRSLPRESSCCAIVLAGLCGCVGAQQTTVTPVDAERSIIRVDHPDFPSKRWVHAVARDPRTGSEAYRARIDYAGAVALVEVLKAGPSRVVEPTDPQRCASRLLAPGLEVAWRDVGTAEGPQGQSAYQLFDTGEGRIGCVAISEEWGTTRDDRARKKQGVCSYFCRNPGSITQQDAAELVRAVTIGAGG